MFKTLLFIGPMELIILLGLFAVLLIGGFVLFTWILQGYNESRGYSDEGQSNDSNGTND